LTRQSILFARNLFAKMMDARVKPAHDDLYGNGARTRIPLRAQLAPV